MTGDYFGYIAAAYGISALVLAALCLFVMLDARSAARRLEALEGKRR